ncbi:MAG: GGDEF domain-containing protein [Acholeplasmataceae bacterium]|nr:GGDEF domain-containing protein [Acholeplasmataceae bacterium]
MRLSDILKLPKQPHSLSIIKDFLEQPLSHTDYQAAFHHYFEISFELELYDLIFTEGIKVHKELEQQVETPYYEKILKSIIHAAINLNKLDEAKYYIELRKQKLPILKQYLGVLDDIAYKKALGLPYLEDILRVIKDVVPDQTKIYCHQELFQLYKRDSQYEMALNSLYALYNYDLMKEYFIEELRLLIKLERFDEVIKKALKELRINHDHAEVVLCLLEVYLKKSDFHKASTLEAEYEELIDKKDDLFKKRAYELIINLYSQMDNKPSLDLYQKRYKALQKLLDKKGKPAEEIKPIQEVIYIDKVPEKGVSHSSILKHLEIAHDLIQFSHMIDEKFLLRDYLRVFFMHVDTYLKVKDYVIYLEGESPNFFHYKKERLYDKTIVEAMLEDTVIKQVQKTGDEIFEETKNMRWNKNIITQNDYEEDIKFVYTYPLGDQGVLSIHFEEEIKDPGKYYDLLKLMSAILYAHVLDEKRLIKLKKENRFYAKVLDAPILAYRELSESKSSYNSVAQSLFNIDKHYHLELFLRDVSYEHVNIYKETIQRLLNKSGETRELLYRYQEKSILEKLYSLKIGDEVIVMSIFSDQTKAVEDTKELIEKATVDQETGLSNYYALTKEFESLLKDKASILLIELEQNMKHIYGTEKMTAYFKEFAQHTKKFFNDGISFRYDFNQLMIILPYNDIRSVTKIVKEYFRYLEIYESRILKFEKFNCNMGILRYPVVTVEKHLEKLVRYLDIALEKAKRDKEEKYIFFVYRDYEDELFEQQVIDHLNIAIEEKTMGVVFNQITDIKKNRVWQYESELALLNLSIDNKYLIQIAKKRNRLVELERFHIKRVCEYLVELEKQTERLIKLTIPISKETFVDPTFNPFILGLFKTYAIPYEFVRLKFDMELRGNQYAQQIQELIDHGISLDTTSLEMALLYPFHALHIDLKKESLKWNSYIHKMKELLEGFQMALVVRNVKTKDQKEALERLGVMYLEGPIYKQLPAPTLIQKIKESL